jgi:hypothetical protein
MRLALYGHDPAFRILERRDFVPGVIKGDGWEYPFDATQEPWAVLDDFDGDGRRDAAVLGRSGNRFKLLVVRGDSISPHVHELDLLIVRQESGDSLSSHVERSDRTVPDVGRGRSPWFLRRWIPEFPVGPKKGVELHHLQQGASAYVWGGKGWQISFIER